MKVRHVFFDFSFCFLYIADVIWIGFVVIKSMKQTAISNDKVNFIIYTIEEFELLGRDKVLIVDSIKIFCPDEMLNVFLNIFCDIAASFEFSKEESSTETFSSTWSTNEVDDNCFLHDGKVTLFILSKVDCF